MTKRVTLNGQELFPSRYASGNDLKDKAFDLVIEKIVIEKMTNPRTKKEDENPVIYFAKAKKGFVLGKEFSESIAIALGEWEAAGWLGQSVQIYPHETRFGIGVRARAVPDVKEIDAEETKAETLPY